jgi:uncharacterized membrane protein
MAKKAAGKDIVRAILLSNLVSVVLFGLRVVGTDNTQYWFLFWNLLLAWTPVLFAWLLVGKLKKQIWKEPMPMFLTLLWLGFLPNSFYLMSDLIHLHNTGDIGMLFDIVLFLSCIWNGLLAGMISLVMVHRQLLKRRSTNFATLLIGGVLLLNSFAIYLGRSLRWNTWDLLVSPAGLLFDVSERIIHPFAHPQVFVTTLTFFVLLSSIYFVVWNFVQALTTNKRVR